MLMLMRFWPYIAGILLLAGGLFYYGEVRYSQGQDNANALCSKGLLSLQEAVSSANAKEIAKVEGQRISYQDALNVRNTQYSETGLKLERALYNIRKLQHESTDKCVNSPIPINFR